MANLHNNQEGGRGRSSIVLGRQNAHARIMPPAEIVQTMTIMYLCRRMKEDDRQIGIGRERRSIMWDFFCQQLAIEPVNSFVHLSTR